MKLIVIVSTSGATFSMSFFKYLGAKHHENAFCSILSMASASGLADCLSWQIQQ